MPDASVQAFRAWSRLMRSLFHLHTGTLPAIKREEARIRRAAKLQRGNYRFPRSGR